MKRAPNFLVTFAAILTVLAGGVWAQDHPPGRIAYAVKFVCGISDETKDEGLVRGAYETGILIANPGTEPVGFQKSVTRALSYQQSGAVSALQRDEIAPGASIAVECNEIRQSLPARMTAQMRSGYLVIVAERALEVSSVYSARPRDGEVSGLVVRRITGRSLRCIPGFEPEGCSAEWTPFDPETDWPRGGPLGPPELQPQDCLPALRIQTDDTGQIVSIQQRQPGPGACVSEPRYCRVQDGQFVEVDSVAEATTPGCRAFATTVCQPIFGGDLPALCGSEPAGAQCETVTICPDPDDVPANAAQTADPEFPALPPLPPPGGATPNPNIAVDGTRAIWPCDWRRFQSWADSGIIAPVPVDNYNFAGLDNGASCMIGFDCQSGLCADPTDDDANDPNVCVDSSDTAAPNPYRWDFFKGNDRWNVEGGGGLNLADARIQGLFYPSMGYRATAGADYTLRYTAAGNGHELFHISAGVRLGNCLSEHGYNLRIDGNAESFDGFVLGAGGVFVEANGIGAQNHATPPALAQQCNDAFLTLRREEERTNQALWDALIAVALHNEYGPAADRTITSRSDAAAILATYRDQVDDHYLPALQAYQDVQPQASADAWAISILELDLGYGRSVARVEHHMGPFVLGAETDAVGKLGVEIAAKSKTDWSAPDNVPIIEPEVAAGVQTVPRASVWGYMSIYGGVDIFVASVTAGIQGELELAGLELPTVADFGIDRALVPIDTDAVAGCISVPAPGLAPAACINVPPALQPRVPPTGAQWRVPWGYNIAADGSYLDGRIEAFIRARILFIRRQWEKTLVSWEGLRRRYFEISDLLPACPATSVPGGACNGVGNAGCCLDTGEALSCDGGALAVEDSLGALCGGRLFDVAGTSLPVFGGVAVPIGEQRDMVYLPVLDDSILANPSPPAAPLDDLGQSLDSNIDNPARWDLVGGFCGEIPG